jgi:hypothetical protein
MPRDQLIVVIATVTAILTVAFAFSSKFLLEKKYKRIQVHIEIGVLAIFIGLAIWYGIESVSSLRQTNLDHTRELAAQESKISALSAQLESVQKQQHADSQWNEISKQRIGAISFSIEPKTFYTAADAYSDLTDFGMILTWSPDSRLRTRKIKCQLCPVQMHGDTKKERLRPYVEREDGKLVGISIPVQCLCKRSDINLVDIAKENAPEFTTSTSRNLTEIDPDNYPVEWTVLRDHYPQLHITELRFSLVLPEELDADYAMQSIEAMGRLSGLHFGVSDTSLFGRADIKIVLILQTGRMIAFKLDDLYTQHGIPVKGPAGESVGDATLITLNGPQFIDYLKARAEISNEDLPTSLLFQPKYFNEK